MRTIKFRGKRLDNGEWVHGDLLKPHTGTRIVNYDESEPQPSVCRTDFHYHNVDPETVGQFTGLLDKNGKEIYSGDIITVNGRYPRVVLWDKMMWALMPTEYYHDAYFWVINLQHPGPDWWEDFSDEFEIIGNIHDNHELLNEK